MENNKTEWYAYVRNGIFSRFAAKRDPLNDIPTRELLDIFLAEVGTPFLTTSRFFDKIDPSYRDEMMYSYVRLRKGQSVRYCLDRDRYYSMV